MQTTTLSFANLHNHGALFADLLRARRQSFVAHARADLPEALGMDFDQYDTPASRWLAVHDFGRVYAGIRLTPTTARVGIYSYMIRDAQRGLLDTLPSDLLYETAPVIAQVWESSRVFIAPDTPQGLRRDVHRHLIEQMTKTARGLGATRVLAMISANWPSWAKRRGLDVAPAGPVMRIGGNDLQVVSVNLVEKMH